MPPLDQIALLYGDDAYVEIDQPGSGRAGGAIGLMGRHVAGKEFLNALLQYGQFSSLVGVVPNHQSAESLKRTCFEHPSAGWRQRELTIVEERGMAREFYPRPAPLLHFPGPLDARHAWARRAHAPGAFALSGVTHTLCSDAIALELCNLVTAPYEPFDSLICTSRAVVRMVHAVADTYSDYLRERFGGAPRIMPRLEHIPLGVDTARFQPADPGERSAVRRQLGIDAGDLVVLFVGRLSHHAKAHPFPMFAGLGAAARKLDRRVHLLLCGWAPNEPVLRGFVEVAGVLCPEVRLAVLDGHDPYWRAASWKAADVFTSLSDNIQETFGLVVVEALASGLPVVCTDWDGYRDLVRDGETGYLIPTRMIEGATGGTSTRLMMGEIDYDVFLAETSQAVAVDVEAAGAAYFRLLSDESLRRRMGEAARRAALDSFAWEHVIMRYEALWAEQDAERRKWLERDRSDRAPRVRSAYFPEPEIAFAGYPTHWLDGHARVTAAGGALDRLEYLLRTPLTNHVAESRISDPAALRRLLGRLHQPEALGVLAEDLTSLGHARTQALSTLAWMLKYGLLEPAGP